MPGVTTIALICPLWGQVAEVTVRSDEDGRVIVVGCPLSEPATACLAPCEGEVRRCCEYAGDAWPGSVSHVPLGR